MNKKNLVIVCSILVLGAGFLFLRLGSQPEMPAEINAVDSPKEIGSLKSHPADVGGQGVDSTETPDRSVAAALSRSPKSQQSLEELQRKSEARWSVKRNRAGFISKLSEGSLPLGTRAPVVGAERFLAEYSLPLLGVEKAGLSLKNNIQEEHGAHLIYEQSQHGVPVFGSRVSLFLDREGNLIHLNSDIYSGSFPAKRGLISSSDSAKLVRAALIERLENEYGMIDPSSYPISEVESVGVLGYRLQRGNVTFVYRYELILQGDHHGSFEVMVDAQEGQLVLFRDLNRK